MRALAAFGKASRRATAALALSASSLIGVRPAHPQQVQFGDRAADAKKAHVLLLTDSVEVTAGSPQEVELRFRVDPGFHINSHAPRDEFLLRTDLKLDPLVSVKVLSEVYPQGTAFHLQMGSASETLDVYQDEFRVRLRLVSQRGSSTLSGALHYQACDSAACFPPRMLPVKVLVTAK